MDQTSEARVKEIEERLQKASPGPWTLFKSLDARPHEIFLGHSGLGIIEVPHDGFDDQDGRIKKIMFHNADLIAHAPDDIRYLLDELKKAREEIGELEADLKANAAMLAKQTDLARQAEIEREEARRFERDESRRRQEMYAALVAEYAKALDSRLSSGLSEDEE